MKRMLINKKVQAAAGTLVLGASVAVAAFSAGPALATQHARAAAAGTLVMESSPVGASTGFNPFQPHSNAYTVGSVSLIYEPLYQENLAHPANPPYPFLATHYAWGDKGKSITFTIRQGVKWSDGTAFSAADVAFTYNLLKANPSISGIGSPIKSVTQSGDKVTLTFPTAQYANFQAIAASVFIVPQHIWSSAGNPATYLDSNPVGTGPYVVKSFDTSGIVMTKNPSYWGGPFGGKGPAVQTVEFPALPSNTNALTNLITGSVQWSGNFLPGFAQATKGKGVVNYSPPGNTNAFWPNLGQWPTNNVAVRQAISDAIDRTTIGTQGEAGLEAPATSAGGLTLPTFQPYLAAGVPKLDVHANAKAAGKVLKAAGFTKSGKYWALKGKIVKLAITDPSSYSDYKADDILAASELQKAGIDATFVGQGQTQWQDDVATGNFQLTQHWGATAAAPYQEYNNWLSSSLATKTNRSGNFEGLKSKAVDQMLAKAAAASTLAQQRAALAPLQKYVATQVPVIPTVYGASWGQFSTSGFTGWPTPGGANQYESAQPSAPTNEVVVLHLQPKG